MRFRTTLVLGLAACLLAPPLAAQQPAAPAPTEETAPASGQIIVNGEAAQPVTGAQVDHQARAITQGGDFLHTPLARFEDRLCPGILGLKPEFAALMIDRMRAAAELFGLWMAPDGNCQPNLIVAFVENGKSELAELADKHPEAFVWMDTVDRKALMAEDGPVRVWTTAVTRTRDGMPVARRDSLDAPPVLYTQMAHSKIYLPLRMDINQVVVFFDREGVKGKSLIQLADYATMRGLARTRPASSGEPLDSILSLFDARAAPPAALTAFDRAYLASLYDGIPNIAGATKIGGVNRQLRRQAAAAGEGE